MARNDKGILIIAAGHPYYGKLALNLCLSIKYSAPGIPVVVATYGDAMSHVEPYRHSFDDIIQMKEEHVRTGNQLNYLKAKVYANEISPFEKTMLLDADTLWFPRRTADQMFTELKDLEFTIGNRNAIEKLDESKPHLVQWANPSDLTTALHHTGTFYNLSSEFMYFRKGDTTNALFKTAQKFFDEPGVPYKRFAGGVPDELAFQIALAVLDLKPHVVPFLPFYWEHQHQQMLEPKDLYDKWWGYSMGGNFNGDHAIGIYNNLASWYYRHFGLRFTNHVQHKRDLMPERNKI